MGHFQEIGIAALPLRLKPRHVEKFRKYRLTDVRERELRKRTEASKFTKMGTWAVRGHTRSLAMSPLLDHTFAVICSNDRAILYRYRHIACYYVKNRKIFPPSA